MIPDEIQNFKKSASLTTNKFAKHILTFAILCMRVSVIRLSTAELPFRINISLLNLTLLPGMGGVSGSQRMASERKR